MSQRLANHWLIPTRWNRPLPLPWLRLRRVATSRRFEPSPKNCERDDLSGRAGVSWI